LHYSSLLIPNTVVPGVAIIHDPSPVTLGLYNSLETFAKKLLHERLFKIVAKTPRLLFCDISDQCALSYLGSCLPLLYSDPEFFHLFSVACTFFNVFNATYHHEPSEPAFACPRIIEEAENVLYS
jgi:hypothetical protein